MLDQDQRDKLDKISVKEIREVFENGLNRLLQDFGNSCKMRKVHELDSQFKDIKEQIEKLNRLDSDAGLPGLMKILNS